MAKPRPVHQIRYRNVRVAIWLNETANGPMHNVTMSRSYKKDEQWMESNSFGAMDLLPLSVALTQAFTWIQESSAATRYALRSDAGRSPRARR